MNIGMVLQLLAEVNKENLIKTTHFLRRIDLRQENNFPDEDEIITLILSKEPVGVLKQSESKFKIFYSIDEEYDLIVVVGIRDIDPAKISLITVYKQEAKRRVRKDD